MSIGNAVYFYRDICPIKKQDKAPGFSYHYFKRIREEMGSRSIIYKL